MNKVFKVIWSEARNAYVVVSEIAKNMGGKSCSTKKLLAMLIATGVMTCAGVEAGAPQYNERATNTSGLETYNQVSGFTNSGAAGLRVEQTTANGGNYVIAGVNAMGTYTEGGTIVLYQKESAGNVYEGEVLTGADSKYVYTATYDKDNNKWTYNTQYQVKENGDWVNSDKGSIRTTIQRVNAPKNLEYKSVVDKKTNGYFQTDTVTITDSVTGATDTKKNTWQTGDVVTAKVSADKQLTVSVNGVETKLTQAVVYVDDNKNKSLKSTNAGTVGNNAIALGKGASALNNSVAIGDGTFAGDTKHTVGYSIAVGYKSKASAAEAIALGKEAMASYEWGMALGVSAKASATRSTALGYGAKATVDASVALGANSLADREAGSVGLYAPSGDESATWKATKGAISIGDQSNEYKITRQITNVAAGKEDTDAVNVAQLKKVNAAAQAAKTEITAGTNVTVNEDIADDGHKTYTINAKDTTYSAGDNVTIDANNKISAVDTTYSAGNGIAITGNNNAISVKLKNDETNLVVNQDGLSLNKALRVDSVDAGGTVIDSSGLSIGNNTYVSSEGLNANSQKITNVAPGEINATSTDAINGSQLNATNERVAKVEGDITNINTEITSIKGDITTINNRIDGIDAEISEINTQVETNTQNIATNTENISKLDVRVTNVEELARQHTTVEEGSNITVTEGKNDDGGKKYTVALNDEISLNKVTTGNTVMNNDGLKVGDKVSVTKDAVTAGSTSISDDGLKIGDKTYVSSDGLNANSQKITNVAAGEADTDAVNVSQLNAASEQIINNSNRISKLGDRVNKVGAGAAALAALHPMDFDPDDKWSFAAGYGNYAGQNAAAIGAYYRPDEKVMFSVGGTVGNGENMVNAGISFALDRTNRVSNSRTAMAREIVDLRGQLTQVTAELASLKATMGVIDETKTKLFPDVPANHWAYEYISKLAGNGYIEGYPDGNFDGNRLMTRYEFAAMLYRAMEKGAALEERIINEFAPELGRIRVDRISGKDGDRDKIERVRVNGPKNERDHYGSKLK
jgi:autotransporter adhesin